MKATLCRVGIWKNCIMSVCMRTWDFESWTLDTLSPGSLCDEDGESRSKTLKIYQQTENEEYINFLPVFCKEKNRGKPNVREKLV